jgi:hypothetical protein
MLITQVADETIFWSWTMRDDYPNNSLRVEKKTRAKPITGFARAFKAIISL